MRFPTLAILFVVLVLLVGCSQQVAEPDWGYSRENGPANWASLSEDYAACGDGMQQSPINLTDYSRENGPQLEFDYNGNAVSAINNGRQVSFKFGDDNELRIGQETYHLKSAHLHAPSEHRVDGESFAAELHMVHADDDGNLAVVGVLFRVGARNDGVEAMLEEAPEAGRESDDGLTLNAESLVPESRPYYHYAGSKTTPPCDEPVDWYVLQAALSVSEEQADRILELSGGTNNRPVQQLRGREIRLVGA